MDENRPHHLQDHWHHQTLISPCSGGSGRAADSTEVASSAGSRSRHHHPLGGCDLRDWSRVHPCYVADFKVSAHSAESTTELSRLPNTHHLLGSRARRYLPQGSGGLLGTTNFNSSRSLLFG